MKEWLQFDEDTNNILEATAKGEADHCLQTMNTIINSVIAESFRRAVKLPYTKNNWANKIHQLRQELKSLRRQFNEVREKEKGPVSCILCKKLTTLRRAEWHRRKRK